jgi:3D (Asp-Asp-Asp) domain-containing protein
MLNSPKTHPIINYSLITLLAAGVIFCLPSISAGQEIIIQGAKQYTIQVDGLAIETTSVYTTTLDILEEAGIGLSGQDYVVPDNDSPLSPGDTIEVIRVTEGYETQEIPLPYSSILVGTDELEIDQRAVLNQGTAGIQIQQTRIRYENGQEVSRSPAGEWVSRQPVDEVVGYGTNVVVRMLDTPSGPIEYWRVVRMRVTSYTAESAGRSPDHPSYGITASGLPAGKGVVAIDPNVVPFRSQVYVEGYGIGIAGDTGGSIKGRIIDLGYDEGGLVSWRGTVDVYYLTPVPPPDEINYLIP